MEFLVPGQHLLKRSEQVSAAAGSARNPFAERCVKHGAKCRRCRIVQRFGEYQIRGCCCGNAPNFVYLSVFAKVFCKGYHDRRAERIVQNANCRIAILPRSGKINGKKGCKAAAFAGYRFTSLRIRGICEYEDACKEARFHTRKLSGNHFCRNFGDICYPDDLRLYHSAI